MRESMQFVPFMMGIDAEREYHLVHLLDDGEGYLESWCGAEIDELEQMPGGMCDCEDCWGVYLNQVR